MSYKALVLPATVFFMVAFFRPDSEAHKDYFIQEEETFLASSSYYSSYSKVDSLVDFAISLEGIPYLYAGKTLDGFDCSGFIFFVYNKFGIDIPAGSYNQFLEGSPLNEEELGKGDLVFFRGYEDSGDEVGHVGSVISTGDEVHFIHSSSGGGGRGITINSLEHPQYKERYLGARRVIEE